MTRSLLRKELRSLVPFAGLVVFFDVLGWVDILLNHFPDQYPLTKLFDHSGEDQALLFLVAFALAAGLLVREADEGTLGFLDGLPLSRRRLFFVKTALAMGLLWTMPLSDLVLRIALSSWSATSLEPQVPWSLLLARAALDGISAYVFFTLGLALSFLRRFSLLVLGLLFITYLLLQELRVPFVSWLNIFSLAEPVFQGRHWLWPGTKLAVQAGLGSGCLALAYGAFMLLGDSSHRLVERLKRRRAILLLGSAGSVLAVMIWAGLLIYAAEKSDPESRLTVRYEPWSTSRAHTARYSFLYPENRAGQVTQLLDQADAVEARVREFLGAQPIPCIMADLTGSAPHTAGVAHWKQVQLDLDAVGGDPGALAAVLAHETTHVYIDHESQDRLSDEFETTRFFHEGLATYIEYHLFRTPEHLARLRRVAAAMHARQAVRFEELIDNRALTLKHDLNLVYPLGEVFVEVLVQRYGTTVAGRVLRAFARPEAPKGLRGAELWRDVFQACGGNFSELEDLFLAKLDQAAAEHRDFVDSLPRLRGAVERDGRFLVVRARYSGQAPGSLVCRIRANSDAPERLYDYLSETEPGVFQVEQARCTERSFWYQLGWQVPGASQPLFEPWVETLAAGLPTGRSDARE